MRDEDLKQRRRRRQRERQKSDRFRLAKKRNKSARASRFFVHCFTVTARLRREIPRFMEDVKMWTDRVFYDSTPEKQKQKQKNCKHLTNWTRCNNRDKFWSSATWLFKCRFRSHRLRCCRGSLIIRIENANSKYFNLQTLCSVSSPLLSV